jgi:oxygen-independent coproporphyrinogen-3 oxidase
MNNKYTVDIDLLRKYDRPGPRYTSYPTAPQFSKDFGASQFLEEIRRTNQQDNPRNLSLYFHIPFCDTLCYFCGCTMVISRNRRRIREYVEYMIQEMQLISPLVRPDRRVEQLHWGGGTPTYLDPEEIRLLFAGIRENFDFTPDAEIGVEIDPRGLTEEHMVALREVGFNRASMGVQDFNPDTQKAVNRIQPEELTRHFVQVARDLGFQSVNLDFIYGLPFQTVTTFADTLERLIDISPDRIALFNYAHVPWLKKHQRIIDPDTLPKPEEKLAILKLSIERLTEAGYVYIGMDHFAKPNDELTIAQRNKTLYRNFQGYSTRANCDLYAFGMSAISQTETVYAQNVKEIPAYSEALKEGRLATERGYRLTTDDQIRRHVIMRLMCDFELDKRSVEDRFGIYFDGYFEEALAQLEEFEDDGLVEFDGPILRVTGMGRLLIRNIAMAFDAYLKTEGRPIYSRTV